MGPTEERIHRRITDELAPTHLVVRNNSAHHAGHVGAADHGETHFYLEIESTVFNGLSRVAQQRLVYRLLVEELAGPVHALELNLSPFKRTPH